MSGRNLKAAAAANNDVLTIDQLRHQDDWVLDTERYRCHVCTRNFTRFRRKHHCRKVGFRLVAGRDLIWSDRLLLFFLFLLARM